MRSFLLATVCLTACAYGDVREDDLGARVQERLSAVVVQPNFGVEWSVVVDPSVSEEAYRVVWEALDDWAGMVGCELRFKLARGATPHSLADGRVKNEHIVFAWSVASYERDTTEGLTQFDRGLSSNVTWKIPSDDTERGRLPNVIRHELGHAFGLDHLPGPSIMQAKGYDVTTVQNIDAAEYDRIWCSGAK